MKQFGPDLRYGLAELTKICCQVFAVRATKSRVLDVARETWQENINDFTAFTEQLKVKYNFQMGKPSLI